MGGKHCKQPLVPVATLTPPADSKLDSKSSLHLVNELADLHSCNNALYFEARRHEDLYMWASRTPNGPSVKCHVQNIHTMDELKMTGNCLKGSRGLCVFDGEWDTKEEWKLLKEMFSHVSGLGRVPQWARRDSAAVGTEVVDAGWRAWCRRGLASPMATTKHHGLLARFPRQFSSSLPSVPASGLRHRRCTATDAPPRSSRSPARRAA